MKHMFLQFMSLGTLRSAIPSPKIGFFLGTDAIRFITSSKAKRSLLNASPVPEPSSRDEGNHLGRILLFSIHNIATSNEDTVLTYPTYPADKSETKTHLATYCTHGCKNHRLRQGLLLGIIYHKPPVLLHSP